MAKKGLTGGAASLVHPMAMKLAATEPAPDASRRVIIEFDAVQSGVVTAGAGSNFVAGPTAVAGVTQALNIANIAIDQDFGTVAIPATVPADVRPAGAAALAAFNLGHPRAQRYLVRAAITNEQENDLLTKPGVHVYADPPIAPLITCGNTPAVGTDKDVERLLCANNLWGAGMDGSGVLVAVVDTGINLQYLNAQGKSPTFDANRSWAPPGTGTPGQFAVNHGTMCAFDVCIAAPKCTLLDFAVLSSTASGGSAMEGLLSDAVKAYSILLGYMSAPLGAGEYRSLVVTNSWGMFQPSWDYPVGTPGNYSDNPQHPFNRIVATLEKAGADILFAAGNCGPECPDERCGAFTSNAIYGANSHPSVLCVAGVDVNLNRVGYSTIGPGRLSKMKPDLAGYTHFHGSNVYPEDSGTSAATPVVAGVVAALRSRRPYDPNTPTSFPAALRQALTSTAIDKGPVGYDYQYGWGVINPCKIISTTPSASQSMAAYSTTIQSAAIQPAPQITPGPAECELHIEWDGAAQQGASPQSPKGSNAALQTFFGRISPDAAPGENALTITGLPAETRAISVWMTEWIQPDEPQAGDAVFTTTSVQLFENGTQCRVRFTLNWSRYLPAAAQVIFGPA